MKAVAFGSTRRSKRVGTRSFCLALCLVLKPVAHALLEYYAKQRGTGTSDIHVALTVSHTLMTTIPTLYLNFIKGHTRF